MVWHKQVYVENQDELFTADYWVLQEQKEWPQVHDSEFWPSDKDYHLESENQTTAGLYSEDLFSENEYKDDTFSDELFSLWTVTSCGRSGQIRLQQHTPPDE